MPSCPRGTAPDTSNLPSVFRERTDRLNLWVLLPIMVAAVFLGVRILLLVRDPKLLVISANPLDAAATVAILLFCVAYRWLYAVHVGPDGVSTLDGFGRRHDVRWDAMRRAIPFLGFLLVPHGKTGTALWVPLFLDDAAGFRESVIAHAPEGNPIRVYLAAR